MNLAASLKQWVWVCAVFAPSFIWLREITEQFLNSYNIRCSILWSLCGCVIIGSMPPLTFNMKMELRQPHFPPDWEYMVTWSIFIAMYILCITIYWGATAIWAHESPCCSGDLWHLWSSSALHLRIMLPLFELWSSTKCHLLRMGCGLVTISF